MAQDIQSILSDIRNFLSNLKDPAALSLIATEDEFIISKNNYQYTLQTINDNIYEAIVTNSNDSVASNLVENYKTIVFTNSNNLKEYARYKAANLLINKVLSAKTKNLLKEKGVEQLKNTHIKIDAFYDIDRTQNTNIVWYTDIVKFFSATPGDPVSNSVNEIHDSALPFQDSPYIEFIHKDFPDNIKLFFGPE